MAPFIPNMPTMAMPTMAVAKVPLSERVSESAEEQSGLICRVIQFSVTFLPHSYTVWFRDQELQFTILDGHLSRLTSGRATSTWEERIVVSTNYLSLQEQLILGSGLLPLQSAKKLVLVSSWHLYLGGGSVECIMVSLTRPRRVSYLVLLHSRWLLGVSHMKGLFKITPSPCNWFRCWCDRERMAQRALRVFRDANRLQYQPLFAFLYFLSLSLYPNLEAGVLRSNMWIILLGLCK